MLSSLRQRPGAGKIVAHSEPERAGRLEAVEEADDSWFFMTADYACGYALEKDTSDFVKAIGARVLGAVRIPLNSSDFSTLLRAQSSKAKIIGLADAGLDTTNSIEQAAEFGIARIDANLLRRVVLATARRFAANSARRNELDVRPLAAELAASHPYFYGGK